MKIFEYNAEIDSRSREIVVECENSSHTISEHRILMLRFWNFYRASLLEDYYELIIQN